MAVSLSLLFLTVQRDTIKSKSLHTFAVYYTGFTGVLKIEGDLSVQPSTTDSDWFDLTPELMYDPNITINNETGVQGYVIRSNVNWLRVTFAKYSNRNSR